MKRPLQIAFFSLVILALGQAFWQHSRLPEKVATHFNGAGLANGWLPRGAHTAWHVATLLFLVAVIQGLVWLIGKLPREYLNLPHRDYWLAPTRAAATQAWVASALLLIGCTLMVFFIGLFELVYRANFTTPSRLNGQVWWFAAGLLAVVATVIIKLFLRFGRKPTA